MSSANRAALTIGLLVALLLAGVVSFYAAGSPDGLERVATDQGITRAEKSSPTAEGPLADYSTTGVENDRLSVGAAGVVGCLVVLTATAGITSVARRRRGAQQADR